MFRKKHLCRKIAFLFYDHPALNRECIQIRRSFREVCRFLNCSAPPPRRKR